MSVKDDFEKILLRNIPAGRRKRLETDAEAEMACLPVRQQAALRYVYLHGFTVTETAVAMRISEVSVQKALTQAFAAMERNRGKKGSGK